MLHIYRGVGAVVGSFSLQKMVCFDTSAPTPWIKHDKKTLYMQTDICEFYTSLSINTTIFSDDFPRDNR